MPKIVNHDDRRREIVEACWNVLAEKGAEGLTMRSMADALGCATGRITHYFVNREEVVTAAINASFDALKCRTDAILAGPGTAMDKLLRIGEELLPLDKRRLQEARVWLAFWNTATTDAGLARENDERHDAWRQDLVPILAQINPNLDSDGEARLFIALVNGLNLQVAVHPSSKNRKDARQTLRAHIAGLAVKSATH